MRPRAVPVLRLASPEVADALEAISRISPPAAIRSLRQGSHARALREARTCYNHLAVRLGAACLRAARRWFAVRRGRPASPGAGRDGPAVRPAAT